MPMPKSLRESPRRGEIYIADLDPAFGREIHKRRPVLIVSSNVLNQRSGSIVVVPLSSIVPTSIGFEKVKISKLKGLAKESVILVDQIRSIDKIRLIKKIGRLSKAKLLEIEEALKLVLGMIEI